MRRLLVCLGLLISGAASAQMDAIYSTYPFNPLALNPAYAGSRDVTSMTFINRRRSVMYRNTYSSQYLTVDTPAGERFGLGFQAFRDAYSVASVGFYGSLSYKYKFSETQYLSIGTQLGVTQVVPPNNYVGNNVYPFSLGLGIQYKTSRFYVGLSSQNLTGSTIYANTSYAYDNASPVFLTAGYVATLTEDVMLKTATVIKTLHSDVKADLNATLWYHKLGLGLWYQSSTKDLSGRAGILGTAELQLGDKFRIGASHDFNAKTSGNLSFDTAESTIWQFFLRYEFDNGSGKVGQMRYF
ncbi:MAG: PorP/SprF family type IX secretion system membrane protein [Siphonobacter sp.]